MVRIRWLGRYFYIKFLNRSRYYRNGLGPGMAGPVGQDIRMNRIFWLPKIFSVLIESFKLIFGPVDSECQIRLNRFPIPFESLTGSSDWIKNMKLENSSRTWKNFPTSRWFPTTVAKISTLLSSPESYFYDKADFLDINYGVLLMKNSYYLHRNVKSYNFW